MNTLTNLVLLSIQVTTNEGYMLPINGDKVFLHKDDIAMMGLRTPPKTYYFTNYHFGIVQGTNRIQLLTLQQK